MGILFSFNRRITSKACSICIRDDDDNSDDDDDDDNSDDDGGLYTSYLRLGAL